MKRALLPIVALLALLVLSPQSLRVDHVRHSPDERVRSSISQVRPVDVLPGPRVAPTASPASIINTYAGSSVVGGGTPTGYGMRPAGTLLDGDGHLLIADQANSVIWLANLTASAVTQFGQSVAPGHMAIVAGTGTAGFNGDDGPATQAELNSTYGLALDGAGNLYIADRENNRIREVSAVTGVITTVAGNGIQGYGGDGGPATQAELNVPDGVVVDGAGNLFIADSHNNRIREVAAATGVITTIAGTGTAGYSGDGGPATQAALNVPVSIALDRAGNLFLADTLNNRAREIFAATGVITTVAGDGAAGYSGDGGPATQAQLNEPIYLALDGAGDIFLADDLNNRIREVEVATGVITTVAGTGIAGYSGDGGPAVQAQLSGPGGVALDSAGNLFITEAGNNRVREVLATTGIITTVAGNGTEGFSGDGEPAVDGLMSYPTGMAIDGGGNLFVADSTNNRIREVLRSTETMTTVAGNGSPGCFYFDPNPSLCYGGDGGPATQAQLNGPQDVAVDTNGNIFIADTYNQRIREVVAATGIITTVAGDGTAGFSGDGGPATTAQLSYPSGVEVDGAGDLLIADTGNGRIRIVSASSGAITTIAGGGSVCLSRTDSVGDGCPATQAVLNGPFDAALDRFGNLFIADGHNNRIREVTATTGVISTVAGTGTAGYGGDGGTATQAEINDPFDLAMDSTGNLFIADYGNNRVREVVAATGVITTVAGTGALSFSGDGGPATLAALSSPNGVAVDGAGNLFIGDSGSNRVRIVRPAVQIPLNVSLEWGASAQDLTEWQTAVERASSFLQDATNGQAIIAPITVTGNAIGWANADVRVYAHNTGIPDATIGGLSASTIAAIGGNPVGLPAVGLTSTSSGGAFMLGAIHLGRSWSAVGPLMGRWTDPDGFRTLVHELGHYALFLYDEYYGYNEARQTRPWEYCTSPHYVPPAPGAPTPVPDNPQADSIMDWQYNTHKYWNVPPGSPSPTPPGCALTRQWQVYHASDWDVISSHYPSMVRPPNPVSPAGPTVALTPCPTCATPQARWLIPQQGPNPDAYLVKAASTVRVLHEGAPYPALPGGVAPWPTVEPLNTTLFYPPNRVEIVGGNPNRDVVRVTFAATDITNSVNALSAITQGVYARSTSLSTPKWYTTPISAVPFVAAQPVLSPDASGELELSSLVITASNLITQTRMLNLHGSNPIAATLYEAGRGPNDSSRTSGIHLSKAVFAGEWPGGEEYSGQLSLLAPPILDGALYLTPYQVRHENIAAPSGGAWALAYLALSCNDPTGFATAHAGGDEGGLDSADGVVNVHFTNASLQNLCVGFTAQNIALLRHSQLLSAAYAIVGSQPLPNGPSDRTSITFHYSPLLAGGGRPQIVRMALPQRDVVTPPPCLLMPTSLDTTAGTVAATVPPSITDPDGAYQAVIAPSGVPPC